MLRPSYCMSYLSFYQNAIDKNSFQIFDFYFGIFQIITDIIIFEGETPTR